MSESLNDFVADLLMQDAFKNMPSRALARHLNIEFPDKFPVIDAARCIIRTVTGCMGEKERRRYQKKYGHLYNREIINEIPEAYSDEYKPYIVPSFCEKTLTLSDMHVPFHQMDAIIAAVKFGKDNGVDSVLLNGDISDQYWSSKFVKIGQKHPFTYQDEIDQCNFMLDYLMEEFPNCKFIFKIANHEDRLEAYLSRTDIKLRGTKIESLLELTERNFDIVESGQYIDHSGLMILHGHEYGKAGGNYVNAAKALHNKTGLPSMCGHHHLKSDHDIVLGNDNVITCYTLGCLCFKHQAYAPMNKWAHGCAIVERKKNGFRVDNRRILNGEIR